MLGLAYVIYSENLHDQGFLDKYCVGFEQFADYLTGKTDSIPKTPEWTSEISEIPAEDIRSLAHRMVESRTMISASWSLTRQHHGEQPHWMAITLACMLGQIGKHGGGFGFGYSASNSIGADYPLLSGGSVPQGKNQVPDFIPVARIADLLLNPGKEFPFDGRTLTYPDIRLVWWAGGNPYHHHQDLNRLAKAWEKPDTIITNEWCWNANAKRADIVLPCTTPVERDDLCLSQRDSYVVRMEKAVDPPPNVRNDYDIFRGIARWMNIEPEFSEGMNPDEWIRRIYKQTTVSDGKTGDLASSQNIDGNAGKDALTFPDWETFCEKGWFQFPIPEEPRVMFKKFVSDPEKYPVDTPSGKIEIFSETVSGFGYADCPGHPVWMEPFEWLGNGNDDQLHMISNQPATKLHSQLDQGATSRSGKINGREPLMIHPNDANKRGIKDLDVVRLYNKRGSCLAAAVVTYAIRQGVVQISTGSWWDPD
ncbi:MAG: molybdopterin-dependent oxidoreductase, partial [Pseudomonadota bacterium]